MQPRISIITPWLDHPEFIADYERAVRAPGVEVIVIDNGSADVNSNALQAMVQGLGGKYIRNEQNRWFSAANNQGLAVATGQIIVFLNNDISGESTWLDQVVRDVGPGALCGPTYIRKSGGGIHFEFIEGWCVAAHSDTWKQLGGWNERSFPMPYCEDAELSFRASRIGIQLIETKWGTAHKGGGTSQSVPSVNLAYDRNAATLDAILRGVPVSNQDQTPAGVT